MRIEFLIPKCTPDNSHGRYVIELVKELAPYHHVTIHAGAVWEPLRSLVRCHTIAVPNRPAIARLASLWLQSILATRRSSAEIVHVQGADAPIGNVVTAHSCNAAMERAVGHGASMLRRANYRIGVSAEFHCLRRRALGRVIAVSEKVKADIEQFYGVHSERTVVIRHGVDTQAFQPATTDSRLRARDRLGLGKTSFIALFVGADYRLKGLITLLKAAASIPVVTVAALGVAPDPVLTALINREGLVERVRFFPVTEDITPFYVASDCFVLPTRYDTFSLATLEAMSSGLPVIVTRAAGVSEILSSGRDSLVLEQEDDVSGLAQQLKSLTTDPMLRVRLGAEARKTAQKNTWREVVERTVSVYQDTIARSRRGST